MYKFEDGIEYLDRNKLINFLDYLPMNNLH